MSMLVIDASVMVKCAVTESGSSSARTIVTGDSNVTAPELILAECANALWKRVHRGLASREEISSALVTLLDIPTILLPLRDLTPAAMAISLELDHRIYDCYYVAAAIQNDCALATADAQLASLAARAGLASRVLFVS